MRPSGRIFYFVGDKMSRFETMINKTYEDEDDEMIYNIGLELDEMEEHFREKLGEEFEEYLGLFHHYNELLQHKIETKPLRELIKYSKNKKQKKDSK